MTWKPGDTIFNSSNLKAIEAGLAESPVEPSMHDPDVQEQWLYLGTVFNLLPSGKYYMPWACSNVEACERCEGTGVAHHGTSHADTCGHCFGYGSVEAYLDAEWYEQADEELEKIDAHLEAGEGDPCDIFIVRAVSSGA